MDKRGEVLIYQTASSIEIAVKLEKESVWLDAHSLAKLFGVNRPAVVKHIQNIYRSDELSQEATCSKMEQVAVDGKTSEFRTT